VHHDGHHPLRPNRRRFCRQLGTMKVNEEISALETFGIAPVEFPRSPTNGGGSFW